MWKKVDVSESMLFDLKYGGLIDIEEMEDTEYLKQVAAPEVVTNEKEESKKRKRKSKKSEETKSNTAKNGASPSSSGSSNNSDKKTKKEVKVVETLSADVPVAPTADFISKIQKNWSAFDLPESVIESLAALNFEFPTIIQKNCISIQDTKKPKIIHSETVRKEKLLNTTFKKIFSHSFND